MLRAGSRGQEVRLPLAVARRDCRAVLAADDRRNGTLAALVAGDREILALAVGQRGRDGGEQRLTAAWRALPGPC